jgi:hypothetical protein
MTRTDGYTLPGWLGSLSDVQRESVFTIMRKVGADKDRLLEEHRRLSPRYGEIAVGGAHIDLMIQAYAREDLLCALNKGATVVEAIEAGKAVARLAAQKFNASRKHEYQVHRPEGMADAALEHIGRQLRDAVNQPASIAV